MKKELLKKGVMVVSIITMVSPILMTGCSKDDEILSPAKQSIHKKSGGTGTDHGYFWTLYYEGGSASISFPNANTYAGNFAISYSGCNDVVGGKGWNPGSARIINYNIGALSGSYNFVGVYGWTTNPLIEYYVAEKGSMTGGTSFGTVSSDGHTYSCYKSQRVNAPSYWYSYILAI